MNLQLGRVVPSKVALTLFEAGYFQHHYQKAAIRPPNFVTFPISI